MDMQDQDAKYVVTLPPPTPNGGLHIGHLAGPFLAADVFAKSLALKGHTPHVTSFSDTNQSYVRATAKRLGRDPMELARGWSENIVETLALYHCDLDHYFEPTTESADFLRQFFLNLFDQGVLKKKKRGFYFCLDTQTFLDEAGVSGFCSNCLEACTCGICEGCGAVTSSNDLLMPKNSATNSSNLEVREVEVLVLELEPLREKIAAFHAQGDLVRPKYRWLVEDSLKGALPDYPITVPGDWGLALDIPGLDGQVINAWPEIMANFVFAYETYLGAGDTSPVNVVNFFGYDNSYFYAIVHVGLLIASGNERFLPLCTMTNEFYNLEHAKFSTSRDHAIWSHDLASRYPADFSRFFLALTAPGFEQGNFVQSEMEAVIERRLVAPWNSLAGRINQVDAKDGVVSDHAQNLGQILSKRVRQCLTLDRFNLRQAAEDALNALELCDAILGNAPGPQQAIDARHVLFVWSTEVRPIMPKLAAYLSDALSENQFTLLPVDLESLCRALNTMAADDGLVKEAV